jgi:DNA modification methylase
VENDENDDVIPETPVVPKTKLGDVYQLGPHAIVCGDSTDQSSVGKDNGSVERQTVVFTDPPYNVNYSGRGKKTSEGIMNDNMEAGAFDDFLDNAFGSLAQAGKVWCRLVCLPLNINAGAV